MAEEKITETPEVIEAPENSVVDSKENIIDFIHDTKKAMVSDEPSKQIDNILNVNVEVPDEFTAFCLEDGWSQEEIDSFVKGKSETELKEDLEYLQSLYEKPEVDLGETETPEVLDKKSDEPVSIDTDVEARIREQITKELTEKFSKQFNLLDEVSKSQQFREDEHLWKTAHKKLDELSKDFPVFGLEKDLSYIPSGRLKGQPIMTDSGHKARAEVFSDITAFRQLGRSMDEAIDDALALYAGRHLKSQTERNVYRDLKKHESKISGSRTGKITQQQYASKREEQLDFIRQTQRAMGVDV